MSRAVAAAVVLCFAALASAAPPAAPAVTPLAIPFLQNPGPDRPDVAFAARLREGTLSVTHAGELVYSFAGVAPPVVLVERARHAGPALVRGLSRADLDVGFFLGADPTRWRPQVPAFDSISVGEPVPGIELVLEARAGAVEKRFRLAPGADPAAIWIEVEGARRLASRDDGRLVVTTAAGPLLFSRPVAFQTVDGVRREVRAAYRVGRRGYGFTVGPYDRRHPLVIDPILSTYLGGPGLERAQALAPYHSASNEQWIYVAGVTDAARDFPFAVEPAGIQGDGGGLGREDAFVARMRHDFTGLAVAVLGGNLEDVAYDVAVDPDTGRVFVVGWTEGDFPMTAANEPGRGLARDGFVARLSPDLGTLEASRYLGGNDVDGLFAVAIELRTDGDPLVYVAGSTKSDDLPGTAGSPQPEKAAGRAYSDGMVALLDPSLALQRATYLGGCSIDFVLALAVSPIDHALVAAGNTSYDPYADPLHMSLGCFPWIEDQTSFGGDRDVFVVRLPERLVAAGTPPARYVGGTRPDAAAAVAFEPSSGHLFLAGMTACEGGGGDNAAEFPFPPAPYVPAQGVCHGGLDAFAVRLDPTLDLVGATLIGGLSTDAATDAVVAGGDLYLLGRTESLDFPWTAAGADSEPAAGEAFVIRLHADLAGAYQATYLGGAGHDESLGQGLAVVHDPRTGALLAFVAGGTESDDLPGIPDVPDVVPQRQRGGSADAFVARLPANLQFTVGQPDLDVEPVPLDLGNVAVGAHRFLPLELRNLGGAPLHVLEELQILGDPAFEVQATGTCESLAPTVAGTSSCTVYVGFAPPSSGRYAGTLWVITDDPDEPAVPVPLAGRSEQDIELLPARPGEEPALHFRDTALGTTFEWPFTIRNAGVAPLEVTLVNHAEVEPTAAGTFSLRFDHHDWDCPEPSPETPSLLGPGASCLVTAVFGPLAEGPQEGVVFVWSDDPDEEPAFLHLFGEGLPASRAPDLVADVWVDYGFVPPGETETRWILASNQGQAPLQLRSFVLSDPACFAVDLAAGAVPCGASDYVVEPETYCTMGVAFTPAVPDPDVDETLTLGSNDLAEPARVVHLQGRSQEGGGSGGSGGSGGAGGGAGAGGDAGGGCSCATAGPGAAWLWLLALAALVRRRYQATRPRPATAMSATRSTIGSER